MIIQDIIDALEAVAPTHLQESYDNSGLIVGNASNEVTGVLVSLDATPEIVDEAVQKGCNVVVSHHPIVFKGLKSITGKSYVERAVIRAIRNDVALYAIHTNLDNVLVNGVNGKIADRLGLMDTDVLRSHPDHTPGGEIGAGLIGFLPEAMSEAEFMAHYQSAMALLALGRASDAGPLIDTARERMPGEHPLSSELDRMAARYCQVGVTH